MIKGIIKYGEDKELEREIREWAGGFKTGYTKKELELSRWKTSKEFGETDLIDWISANNDQHIETGLQADKEYVFSVISSQMKLFLNSAGNRNGTKEEITEEMAITFELWVNQKKIFKEISEILQVSAQMVVKYLTKLFTLINLELSSGINIKSKLLEQFFTPEVRRLRVAKQRQKGFRRSRQDKANAEWALNRSEFVFTNQAGNIPNKPTDQRFKKLPFVDKKIMS